MDGIRFRVRRPDGRVDELLTETNRVLIGSGSHCEIRLPMGAARAEHVLIVSTAAGWRALARSLAPMPKLDGVEFTEAPLRGDCRITVGETQIELSPSTGAGADGTLVRARRGRNSRIYVYLALGLGCAGALYAARPHPKTAAAEPKNVPPLWDSAAAKCPQTGAEPALATANTRLDLALAKQERSPFHAEDGVAAVSLYQDAEACFRAAGQDDDAKEARADADRLAHDMVERFRGHRLRLQRALATEQWGIAQRESGVLLTFLPSDGGEYVVWLSNLRRRLQLRYGSKGKKES